jgi:hypothetical protein
VKYDMHGSLNLHHFLILKEVLDATRIWCSLALESKDQKSQRQNQRLPPETFLCRRVRSTRSRLT